MAKCNIDYQGNSTGCVPDSSVARRWRWALRTSAAHIAARHFGGLELLTGLRRVIKGHIMIKMPSYSLSGDKL
jgi:hypothetical protein